MFKSLFNQKKNRVSVDTSSTTPLISPGGVPNYTEADAEAEVVMNVTQERSPPPLYRKYLSPEEEARVKAIEIQREADEQKVLETLAKAAEEKLKIALAEKKLAEEHEAKRVEEEAKRVEEEAQRVAEEARRVAWHVAAEARRAIRLREEEALRVIVEQMRLEDEARIAAEKVAEQERRVAKQARLVEEQKRLAAEENRNAKNQKIIEDFKRKNPLLFEDEPEPEYDIYRGSEFHHQQKLYRQQSYAQKIVPFVELYEVDKIRNRNNTFTIPQYDVNGNLVMTEMCHWRQYGEKNFGRDSDHINLYYKIQPGLLGNADDEALFNKLMFEEFKSKYDAEQKRKQMIEEREKAEAKKKQDIANAISKIADARNEFIKEIEAAKAAEAKAAAAKAAEAAKVEGSPQQLFTNIIFHMNGVNRRKTI
uniref:Uncharacterized protein n=1 Tax=viral metagenome TaxID=1070528 RepID=A0A6C0EZF9_9ZZZZ